MTPSRRATRVRVAAPPLAPCAALLMMLIALAGCASPPPAGTASPSTSAAASAAAVAATAFDDSDYRQARAQGQQVLRIDPQRSLIAINVRRGGTLARFGHDHVVAARAIEGRVAPQRQRADFQFRLDQMTVDEAALRTEAGFDTQPSADAVDGTRTNMLTRVLDAEHYPLVKVHAEGGGDGALTVSITLHGVTRTQTMAVRMERRDGALTVSGSVNLKQTDFALVPFAVMGGALAVQDQMELRFRLVAAE
ncbi:YceI family protein [Rugamonas sp.]|uniref:YceI family protein n=1 Tax=Rugamonas sp. TaxID=1926287 RepID=UPI0025CF72A6|nr:YceI family protein [Rugamonas sp.]